MVLAQELKRHVCRRVAVMVEGIQTLLSCRHRVAYRGWKVDSSVREARRIGGRAGQIASKRLYRLKRVDINLLRYEDGMAFRPNYGRDRAERDRAGRARAAEKLKKKEEKTAQRKAARDAAEGPTQGMEHITEDDTGQSATQPAEPATAKNDKES